MMALLREKWQQLSNEEKEPFEKRALADKARYAAEIAGHVEIDVVDRSRTR